MDVMPVDLFVEQPFFDLLKLLPTALTQSGSDLVLIGTKQP